MTSDLRACFALDLGAATTSAAVLGEVAGRRRLLAASALPATVEADRILDLLVDRICQADPRIAEALGVGPEAVRSWPRLVARSAPPPVLAVLATTVRERHAVELVAGRAGWRTRGASLDVDGPVGLTRIALERDVAAVAAAATDPTSREETAALGDLGGVVAGLAGRGMLRTLILVGGAAAEAAAIGADEAADGPLFAPGPEVGDPPGAPLARLLDRLDPVPDSARRSGLRAVVDLAAVLGRRIELVEIGLDGGLRAVAGPAGLEAPAALVPAAALAPPEPDDDVIDGVLRWSTTPLDRHRMRDRLHELRLAPWVEAHGDGALLRLTAARAATDRLVRATPELGSLPAPDLIVASGGAWAAAPGPAIALAIADVVRRPGASQLAYDHARLLGPIGMLDGDAERQALLAEVADDLLAPLGSVIVPQGLRAGRSAGSMTVSGPSGETELELVPGGLELVDLPPGQLATAELRFRDPVGLGTRGRHVSIEVGGGLGGLLVDLRDVPLRLPERAERRRALLGAWQAAFWSGADG